MPLLIRDPFKKVINKSENKVWDHLIPKGPFPMGELFLTDNSVPTVIPAKNTFYTVSGNYIQGMQRRFDMPDPGRLRYLDSLEAPNVYLKHFHTGATVSFSADAANTDVLFAIRHVCVCDGNLDEILLGSHVRLTVGKKGDYLSTAIHVMAHLGLNDYLSVVVANLTNTKPIIVRYLNLFAAGVPTY